MMWCCKVEGTMILTLGAMCVCVWCRLPHWYLHGGRERADTGKTALPDGCHLNLQ